MHSGPVQRAQEQTVARPQRVEEEHHLCRLLTGWKVSGHWGVRPCAGGQDMGPASKKLVATSAAIYLVDVRASPASG